MNYQRVVSWTAGATLGVLVLAAAFLMVQIRKPPIVNAWYVALGSSFAAGAGLGPLAPGSPWVSYRSINGYPQQLARLLRMSSFTDMTSSGSTVPHILHGGQMLLGPQLDALGPNTQLVTITSGGNDVSYVGDLGAVAAVNRAGVVGNAVRLFWNGPQPVERRAFAGLAANLKATIQEIRKRSPAAKIVVVTYPVIIPGTGTCPTLGISNEQASLMRAVGIKLAQTTSDTATVLGATVVNMAALSAGHDACSSDPWVNGFAPKDGAIFHPTLAGAHATALAIAATIEQKE